MPKNWCLQYQKRFKDFSEEAALKRITEESFSQHYETRKRLLDQAHVSFVEAASKCHDAKATLHLLMELGPNGLAQLEGEEGEPLSFEEFRDKYLQKKKEKKT